MVDQSHATNSPNRAPLQRERFRRRPPAGRSAGTRGPATPGAHVNASTRSRMRCPVEHLFVIQPGSGLLLDHLSHPGAQQIDPDAVAGMLTAIEHFVRDSLATGDSAGLGEATVGRYRLVISHGPLARVAVFVQGKPRGDLSRRLDRLNEGLHSRYGQLLSASQLAPRRGGYLPSDALESLARRRNPGEWHGLRWMSVLAGALALHFSAWL